MASLAGFGNSAYIRRPTHQIQAFTPARYGTVGGVAGSALWIMDGAADDYRGGWRMGDFGWRIRIRNGRLLTVKCGTVMFHERGWKGWGRMGRGIERG